MRMKMLEAKVFAALCTLLIIHFGSADHAGEGSHAAASTSSAGSEGSSVESPTASTVAVASQFGSHQINDTQSLSSDAPSEEKKNGSVTTTPGKDGVALPSNATQPLPPSPPSVSDTSTTQVPLTSSGTTGLSQGDHNKQPEITVTAGPSDASADSGNHTNANSSAEVTSSEPPKMEPTTAGTTVSSTSSSNAANSSSSSTTTTTTSNRSSNSSTTTTNSSTTTTNSSTTTASNSSSTTGTTNSSTAATSSSTSVSSSSSSSTTTTTTTTTQVSAMKTTSAPPLQSTSPTQGPHQGETSTRPSSSTTQGKGHVASPSQLNVNGEDTKMVPSSPKLDPLLAGLVSFFIITAVITILLLFLKLRKRGNQPEFRRLQDLPMDDMMEDTPLSMYSY